MDNLKKNKFLIIFCIVLVIVSILVLYYQDKDKENYRDESEISLKRYEENEYIPVNITYDQMARIYLQDYVYKLIYERENAYLKLDENYRKEKFASFDEFDKYVDSIMSLKLQAMTVEKYAISDKGNYIDYDIYDSDDNLFIFRETGVMQYTVFFDRYTVNMK